MVSVSGITSPSVNFAIASLFVLVLCVLVEFMESVNAIVMVLVVRLIGGLGVQEDWDGATLQDWSIVLEALNDLLITELVLIPLSIVTSKLLVLW